jgi:hypothetical protein
LDAIGDGVDVFMQEVLFDYVDIRDLISLNSYFTLTVIENAWPWKLAAAVALGMIPCGTEILSMEAGIADDASPAVKISNRYLLVKIVSAVTKMPQCLQTVVNATALSESPPFSIKLALMLIWAGGIFRIAAISLTSDFSIAAAEGRISGTMRKMEMLEESE